MGRVQLALNVANIDEAIEFYSKLFQAEPAKREDGYANFAIADPPLKLVLMQGGAPGTLNHLGVEVESPEEVAAATKRLQGEGLETRIQEGVDCCFAVQDKVWVTDPAGAPWEVYAVLKDTKTQLGTTAGCC